MFTTLKKKYLFCLILLFLNFHAKAQFSTNLQYVNINDSIIQEEIENMIEHMEATDSLFQLGQGGILVLVSENPEFKSFEIRPYTFDHISKNNKNLPKYYSFVKDRLILINDDQSLIKLSEKGMKKLKELINPFLAQTHYFEDSEGITHKLVESYWYLGGGKIIKIKNNGDYSIEALGH